MVYTRSCAVRIDQLPQEMLLNIFSMLDLDTLTKVMLVNRRWRDVGSRPELWEDLVPVVKQSNVWNVLESPRLSRINAYILNKGVPGTKMTKISTCRQLVR